MTMESNEMGNRQGKLGAAGSWLLRNFLSLLTAIVLGAGLGAGIFYGGRSLLGLPAEPAPASSGEDRAELIELGEQLAALEGGQADLEQRVESLERENAAQQDALLTLLDSAAEAVDVTPEVTAEPAQGEDITGYAEEVALLTARIEALEQGALPGDAVATDADQWPLLRAMMLLLRARISLLDADFGQARDDVELARTALLPFADMLDMDIVISRLDRVLDEIADTPDIAADDVNIAWDLLVRFYEEYVPAQMD